MQHRLPLLLLGLVFFAAAGCGTLNHMQYQVNAPATRSGAPAPITSTDREAVKELLRASAQRLNLDERTEASLVPGTIVYFLGPDSDNPIKLLAWNHNNHIMVDFMHAPGVPGETAEFQSEKEKLWLALEREFGRRVRIMPMREHAVPGSSRSP